MLWQLSLILAAGSFAGSEAHADQPLSDPVQDLAAKRGLIASHKIVGGSLGFRSIRSPVRHWAAHKVENRWQGKLADTFRWGDIKHIHVLYLQMHIRGPRDVEAALEAAISGAQLVDKLPDDVTADLILEDGSILLQALLDLKDGKRALISLTGRCCVVENNRGVGLALTPSVRNEKLRK
jgi:hypothetical protein